MSLIERLQEKEPDRDVLFTAIDELTSPEQIRQFYQEYIFWLWDNTDDDHVRQDPEQAANVDIGYATVYFGKETVDRWKSALPKASHLVFGKDIPWGDGKEVSEYVIVFKADNEQVAQAVIDSLREDLLYHKERKKTKDPLVDKLRDAFSEAGLTIVDNFFPTFDMIVEQDRNPQSKYMAAKLHVEDRGSLNLASNQIYVLLCGYVQAVQRKIIASMGIKPDIFIERVYKTKPQK